MNRELNTAADLKQVNAIANKSKNRKKSKIHKNRFYSILENFKSFWDELQPFEPIWLIFSHFQGGYHQKGGADYKGPPELQKGGDESHPAGGYHFCAGSLEIPQKNHLEFDRPQKGLLQPEAPSASERAFRGFEEEGALKERHHQRLSVNLGEKLRFWGSSNLGFGRVCLEDEDFYGVLDRIYMHFTY